MIDVEAALRSYARALEAALPRYLPQGGDKVSQAMRYSMEGSGKRIRPALVMSFCELYNGQAARVMPLAVALEMIHTYSLIHDDLPCMDNDDVRRGRPSCHRAFGEATALLAGDALLTEAFACAAATGDIAGQAVLLLSRAAGIYGMVDGQQMDLQFEHQAMKITRNQLEEMNRKKTGALITAACLLGCIAAGADAAQTKAAENYADALGLLFQVTDDILDETGSSEAMGKTLGKDKTEGKSTWVSVLGLRQAQQAAEALAAEARAAITPYAAEAHLLYALPRWLTLRKN